MRTAVLPVSRRNKPPSVQPSLFASDVFPSWEKVRRVTAEKLPTSADRQKLADYLNLSRSSVYEMLNQGKQPSYARVISILQYLQDKGLVTLEQWSTL